MDKYSCTPFADNKAQDVYLTQGAIYTCVKVAGFGVIVL